jgi:large subunit ribosomal protein L4
MNAKIYSKEGKETGSLALPEAVFGVTWSPDLVHEVVIGMQANARANTAHTKDRSEVRGGGKKPWKQKGTGRARHGSNRSPIWTGGGVTFGPRNERVYTVKINKKAKAKALASVLSKKFVDQEVIFIDSLTMGEPKTKEAKAVILAIAKGSGFDSLATKRKNAALVVLATRDEATEKSFRNFGNIEVMQAKDVNPVELLTYKYVVVADPQTSLEIFEKRIVATPKTK